MTTFVSGLTFATDTEPKQYANRRETFTMIQSLYIVQFSEVSISKYRYAIVYKNMKIP